MRGLIFIFLLTLVTGCGKKAVEIDLHWAENWMYAYDHNQTLSISENGWAVYSTNKGSHKGYARIKENVLCIGTGKFLITKAPIYEADFKRWEIEIDNMQFLHY